MTMWLYFNHPYIERVFRQIRNIFVIKIYHAYIRTPPNTFELKTANAAKLQNPKLMVLAVLSSSS